MKRISVVHVITRLDPGGSTTNTLETVKRLDPEQYYVTLLTGDTPAAHEHFNELESSGVDVHFIDGLQRAPNVFSDMAAWWACYRFFAKHKPHIVHTHCSKAGFIGRWAAKHAGIKHIIHTPHGHVFHDYFPDGLTRIYIMLERWSAGITHDMIALTPTEKKEHLDLHIGRDDHFHIVPSGIDIVHFQQQVFADLRAKLNIPSDAFVMGALARLVPIKGLFYLVEAMRRLVEDDIYCIVAGDGELKEDLQRQVDQHGLGDRVFFVGHLPDPRVLFESIDIFVLPSLNEGMGRVLLESMAAGIPVIATEVGGIIDVVVEDCGLLVPPKNAPAIVDAVRILKNNPDKCQSLRERGRARVTEEFGIIYMVERIDQIYQKMLKRK